MSKMRFKLCVVCSPVIRLMTKPCQHQQKKTVADATYFRDRVPCRSVLGSAPAGRFWGTCTGALGPLWRSVFLFFFLSFFVVCLLVVLLCDPEAGTDFSVYPHRRLSVLRNCVHQGRHNSRLGGKGARCGLIWVCQWLVLQLASAQLSALPDRTRSHLLFSFRDARSSKEKRTVLRGQCQWKCRAPKTAETKIRKGRLRNVTPCSDPTQLLRAQKWGLVFRNSLPYTGPLVNYITAHAPSWHSGKDG